MSYIKHNFVDGDVLMADHLNTMEDQIVLNEEAIAQKADGVHSHEGMASESWVAQQIQMAINDTWEASY